MSKEKELTAVEKKTEELQKKFNQYGAEQQACLAQIDKFNNKFNNLQGRREQLQEMINELNSTPKEDK